MESCEFSTTCKMHTLHDEYQNVACTFLANGKGDKQHEDQETQVLVMYAPVLGVVFLQNQLRPLMVIVLDAEKRTEANYKFCNNSLTLSNPT